MSITLELSQELESQLATKAASLGLSLNEYLTQVLAAETQAASNIETGADIVAYWQREGLIGTRTDIKDSVAHSRQIRAQAEKRMIS